MAQVGHYNAAIDLFTEAIRLDPTDFRYVNTFTTLLFITGVMFLLVFFSNLEIITEFQTIAFLLLKLSCIILSLCNKKNNMHI